MLIKTNPVAQRLRALSGKKPSGAVQPGDLPKDTITVNPIESATESLTHKPGTLHRPVILINGLARDAHDWDKMVPWLTSNPDNEFGGVYQKGGDQAFEEAVKSNPKAKVFVLDPSDNLASPRVLGGEVRRMIDHILRHGKAEEVDLVGHSQGGLDILAAIDQGEDQIQNVVTLATPWKGAAVASVARRFDGLAGGTLGGVFAPVDVTKEPFSTFVLFPRTNGCKECMRDGNLGRTTPRSRPSPAPAHRLREVKRVPASPPVTDLSLFNRV